MNSMAQDSFNTETKHSISMSQCGEATMCEESCICISNEEVRQKLVEIQQLAGMLETKNKKLGESVHFGKKSNHYFVLTRKKAEFEKAFNVLQTKIDDVSARVLNLLNSCNCSTCHEVSNRVIAFDNEVQKLRMDNRNLLNLYTLQEDLKCTTSQCLAECEKQTEVLETIKENQMVSLQETEECLRQKDEHAKFMECELETMNGHEQTKIRRLRAEICTLQCKLDDATEVLKVGVRRRQELTHVKSLMEKKKAEVKKLTDILQKREEHDKLQNQQNRIVMDDLAKQKDKQYKEIQILKTSQQNLLCQLEEADLLILNKDELITKQSREIADYQKTIEEQQILIEDLRKSVRDLKDEVEEAQLELIIEQTRDNHHNQQEELKKSNQQEEEKKKIGLYWWFLKLFLFIVTVVVNVSIFGSFLTDGLVYSCNIDCELVEPIHHIHPIPF